MPFTPKHKYSAMIYAEIICSIGASLINLMGPTVALSVFSLVGRPVGVKDSKKLITPLGLKRGNAASAAVASYAGGLVLDVDSELVRLDPKLSERRIFSCPYGTAILHYKMPLCCEMCNEYVRGISAELGASARWGPPRIAKGDKFCVTYFECPAPLHTVMPNMSRTGFAVKMIKAFADRNLLIVSTLSAVLVGLGQRASEIIGGRAALIPARGAYDGGVYHCNFFSGQLGLSGGLEAAVSLVANVRETLGCSVKVNVYGNNFSVVTNKCPQAAFCRSGEFLEVACVSYTRGLVSRWGSFDGTSTIRAGVCIQEFRARGSSGPVGGAGADGTLKAGTAVIGGGVGKAFK